MKRTTDMERSDIQRLRELPIESVAERLGLRVVRHKSLCPFHDDSNPSLSFSVSRNSYKCFVCDAHGGTIDLAMKVLGRDFVETCHWLADSSNVILSEWKPVRTDAGIRTNANDSRVFEAQKYRKFFERPFINQAAGEFLFEKRHLDPRVVRWCRLTSYTDRNGIPWLQIPYYDIDGTLTGVQWRNLMCPESGIRTNANDARVYELPRFRFPYGSNCHIYNLPVLKLLKPGEELWIAEGCSDCWSLLSSGHKAIAIPSATLLKPKDLEPLIQLSSSACPEHVEGLSFHMFPDADIPGEKLFLQLKAVIPSITRHSLPSDCKDYSDYYLKYLWK